MSEVSLTHVGWETHQPHGFHSHLQPLPFLDEYVGVKICFDSYEYNSEDLDLEVYEEVCFLQKHEVMLDDNKALHELSPLLSEKRIPQVVHSRIIRDMVNSYSTTRSDFTTESDKDVPVIVFEIILETGLSCNEEEAAAAAMAIEESMEADDARAIEESVEADHARAIEESMEADDVSKPTPAAECAIHSLEKVILDPAGSSATAETTCAICLENLHPGLRVTRMPCSHMFHGDCIIQWLKTSHVCPLCRFQMPTDQLGQCYDEDQEMCF